MFTSAFRTLAGILIAALAVASCDRPSASEPGANAPRRSAAVVVGSDGNTYKLLEGQIDAPVRSSSAWIGPLGGVVAIVGTANGLPTAHTIIVPPLAVLKNTLFTMSLSSGNTISVNLRAQQKTLLGGLTDVGQKGFNLPVTLTMSVAGATNLTNPLNTVILYDPENGKPLQRVPGIAIGGQLLVTGFLNHFSKYTAAED